MGGEQWPRVSLWHVGAPPWAGRTPGCPNRVGLWHVGVFPKHAGLAWETWWGGGRRRICMAHLPCDLPQHDTRGTVRLVLCVSPSFPRMRTRTWQARALEARRWAALSTWRWAAPTAWAARRAGQVGQATVARSSGRMLWQPPPGRLQEHALGSVQPPPLLAIRLR